MIHYHGTPITPRAVLHELAGRNFCVPFSDARDVGICHEIGQSVMIDNGAFSFWKAVGEGWRGSRAKGETMPRKFKCKKCGHTKYRTTMTRRYCAKCKQLISRIFVL